MYLAIGTQQSPIDLAHSIPATLGPLQLNWKCGPVEVDASCETIKFLDGGDMSLGNVNYKLVKAHIHRPSEHLVDGRRFAMEIHVVHAVGSPEDQRFSVVGIFVEPGEEESAAFTELLVCGRREFDPNSLLPPREYRQYDRYAGSLTTPPYSEDVIWSVLVTPITAAQNQLDLVPEHARELWPRNRRYVLRGG